MAQIKFHKVVSLPGSLENNSFYFVQNGNYAEGYLTNSAGEAKSIGNSTMITTIANALINDALASYNTMEIVVDIDARNTLASGSEKNLMILVIDATDDPTVNSGSALYAYDHTEDEFHKLSEYESMDVSVTWDSISGKPSSTPAQIDSAIAKAHEHANKAVLDKFSEDGEGVLYNGAAINSRWTVANW